RLDHRRRRPQEGAGMATTARPDVEVDTHEVDPVVDAAHVAPFGTIEDYREAIATIRSAAAAYYKSTDLAMDDASYDALVARVRATEAVNPTWSGGESVVDTIAAGAAAGGDIAHTAPMLSLDNVFTEDELRGWAARLDRTLGQPVGGYTVEPKIDGMA